MTDGKTTDHVIRRAEMHDRDELVRVLNAAFARDEAHPFDFLKILPHLFETERMGDHFVYLHDGRILGCVGLYPYQVRVAGVSFYAAGVGQVGTLPEARGGGVMTALLKRACQEADAAGYEFCWLGGDRIRYGHFGWATGGVKMSFNFYERFLPAPPPQGKVRPLDPEQDFELVRNHLTSEADTVVVGAAELGRILRCDSTGGWVSGDAFIAYRRGGHSVYLARGRPEQIASLLSHHLRWLKARTEGGGGVTVECSAGLSSVLTTCQMHYASMSIVPSGMFRVGRLVPFLEKACQVAQPEIAWGAGSVSLTNSETGEGATVACSEGRLSVAEVPAEDAYSLGRRELSEVCFGLCPVDLHLPGLPQDSFLKQVFPLRAHWSRFFGV